MGKKQLLDKFYTKPEVVKNILKDINLDDYDLIIEPSAGAGSFTNLLPKEKTISIDIMPESDGVIEMDWFDYQIPKKYKKVLIIGNPPFGERNNLSKRFIEHALSFENVYSIVFILPNVFKKHTNQRIIPTSMVISKIEELPRNSFLYEGEDYHVPCSLFYITKDKNKPDLRFDVVKYSSHTDFEIVKVNDDPDFFVMGAALNTVKNIQDVHKNNRGYYIKSNIQIDELKARFKDADWNKYANSSVNGGVSWFSKPELFYTYSLIYDK